MHDVIIRGGKIVDGTGKPAFIGDVAIAQGRVAAVGKDLGNARRTVKADGLLVTPAWVDVHTHYDGQVAWDQQMTPSLWHGVATVVHPVRAAVLSGVRAARAALSGPPAVSPRRALPKGPGSG